jgi:hypothetical protein
LEDEPVYEVGYRATQGTTIYVSWSSRGVTYLATEASGSTAVLVQEPKSGSFDGVVAWSVEPGEGTIIVRLKLVGGPDFVVRAYGEDQTDPRADAHTEVIPRAAPSPPATGSGRESHRAPVVPVAAMGVVGAALAVGLSVSLQNLRRRAGWGKRGGR